MAILKNIQNRRHIGSNSVLFISAVFLLFILIGCDSTPTEVEDYTPEPILTAFLYNGEPVGEVRLERVANLYGYYDPEALDNLISNAEVYLIQLDGTSAGDTLFFSEDLPGVYFPNEPDTVQSTVHYRLEAKKSSENLYLWAESIVPDTFSLVVNPAPIDTIDNIPILDTMTWGGQPITLQWSESNLSAGYVMNIVCEEDSYIPLDPEYEFTENEDSSRASFDIALEGALENTIPWIHFRWQGWHRIDLLAVDEGYFEYFISLFRMQFGQVDALEYNVQGGLGIFAGVSRRSFRVYVDRAE